MISLGQYLTLAFFIFGVGLIGALTRKSAILVFLCIELMLNSVNVVLLALGFYMKSPDGAVFAFFVLAISAAEAAVGVAIIVSFIRRRGTSSLDAANLLKW